MSPADFEANRQRRGLHVERIGPCGIRLHGHNVDVLAAHITYFVANDFEPVRDTGQRRTSGVLNARMRAGARWPGDRQWP